MNTRKMTSLPGVTVFTTPDGNYDNNVVLPKNLIIIHTEDGFKKGTEARFTDPQSHVSAQYGVNQDGTYDEYVDEDQVAYHAGNYAVNQRSIGIEHEDFAQPNSPRPDILYQKSGELVRDICQFWGIPIDRDHIKKHSEVSGAATACPDSLDIDRIVREANNSSGNDLRKELDQLRADRDKNWNLYQADEATILSLNQSITKLNTDLSTLTTQLQGANTKIETLQSLADQVTPLIKERDQAISDRDACLKAEDEQQAKIKELEAVVAKSRPQTLKQWVAYIFNLK